MGGGRIVLAQIIRESLDRGLQNFALRREPEDETAGHCYSRLLRDYPDSCFVAKGLLCHR